MNSVFVIYFESGATLVPMALPEGTTYADTLSMMRAMDTPATLKRTDTGDTLATWNPTTHNLTEV